jgi:hypothetical protein
MYCSSNVIWVIKSRAEWQGMWHALRREMHMKFGYANPKKPLGRFKQRQDT